jgi:hypothetical protein
MAVPAVLCAQAPRNATEFVTNEHQIAVGRAQFLRDKEELREFEAMLKDLQRLHREDPAAYEKLNLRILSVMDRELDQAMRKATHAKREVRQSRREAKGERREMRASSGSFNQFQLHDDKRDLRDDRRDRRSSSGRAVRMGTILTNARGLEADLSAGDASAMVRNQRLLGEFLDLLRADLRATAAELGEDRGERREDRRERITDLND